MRYVIYGAGAVGATIGARLFEQDHEVVLVARGAHHAALRDHGLTFGDPERTRVLRIDVVDHPGALAWRHDDVVVLGVKGQDTQAALEHLAAAAPATVAVVCAQNGVENERQALRRFAGVYGMCVMMPATHIEPGAVDADSLPVVGILDVGCYPKGVDALAERVASDLTGSGFSSRPDADIMRWKHQKLLLNISTVLRAAAGPGDADDDEEAGLRRLMEEQLRAEALACYAAAGIDLPDQHEHDARYAGLLTLRPIAGRPRTAGSGWQSLARRTGTVEVDFVNGEVVLMGRMHGIATPANELLQHVVRDMARRRDPPGSQPVRALAAMSGSW